MVTKHTNYLNFYVTLLKMNPVNLITRLIKGLTFVIYVCLTTGCLSYISMETPQTLPKGEFNFTFAGATAGAEDQEPLPFAVFKMRGGVDERVDIGARLELPNISFMVDGKYQFFRTDLQGLDFALLGGVGLPSILHFQPILGRQIGPIQIYTSYRYQMFGIPNLDLDYTIDHIRFSIHQVFAGIQLKITSMFFCQGEGGYILDYEIGIVAVGCGILFPR